MFEALKHNPFIDRLLRRVPPFYGRAMKQLNSFEAMDFTARSAHHDEALQAVLARARKLPGYPGAPASDCLQDWPILTKQHLLGRERLYAVKGLAPRPSGETGGTTGQPLKVKRTLKNIVFEQAVVDHLCATRGVNAATARIAVLRGNSIPDGPGGKSIHWIDEGQRKRIYNAHRLGPETAQLYIESMREYAPDILFCYPSALATLAANANRLDGLRIPLIYSSSEVLQTETAERARDVFGADILDFYGHAERIACAWSLNGGGFRFLGSYGHIELMPCGDGRARIIATSLDPNGQIFVRYDTGDIAVTGTEDRQTLQRMALGLLPFHGIEGRDNEFIELHDGRRVIGLNHIPRGATGAMRVQLHHAAENLVDIYVTPGPDFGPATLDTISTNFYAKLPAHVEARFWTVDKPVTETNGKAPLLLRRPAVPAARSRLSHSVPVEEAA
ncbi:MAG: hypothetical protein AB7F96_16905 [Beijerinckiaceae bacterium]